MTKPSYDPKPEHKFTFGLWTVGNPGGDPFGPQVRPRISPVEIVQLLSEVGAYGVNLHDNDLIPIDATAAEHASIVKDFKQVCKDTGITVPMATTNLFSDPIFRDGAFTASDARVRAYALQKTMRAMDLGVDLGAKTFVFWGGREGVETDACRSPITALEHYREAFNYLTHYCRDQGYELKFALEAKPNEPRSDNYLPTTGAMLGFIETLDHSEMVGVNPETAHELMSGLNFSHAVAQAIDAKKLFHIDLNDQNYARYDQDLRFGSQNPKASFFLVKLLEDTGYEGMRHFDAHAYRSEDYEGVKDFARGCMRNYLIFKQRAAQFAVDGEIQALLKEIQYDDGDLSAYLGAYSSEKAAALKERDIDRAAISGRGLGYERLDQLTLDLLYGLRD